MTLRATLTAVGLAALTALAGAGRQDLQGQEPRVRRLAAVSAGDLRTWDPEVVRMTRSGTLQLRLARQDTLLEGRRHERFNQLIDGVPVYGGGIVRQTDERGATVSIFGTLHEGVRVTTTPTLDADAAQAVVTGLTGVELGPARRPRLVVMPRGDGAYALVYAVRVATAEDITLYFVDAETGAIVHQRSDAHRQTSAVGLGVGVLGDRKKVSASAEGGGFIGADKLRPPALETFDMRGNLARTISFLNDVIPLGANDFSRDSDNDWTDGANVDAHVYTGYTYDYFFKRFGRLGLDNANIKIRSLTHPVNRTDALTASSSVLFTFFVNAFYAGDGIMVYGEGLPPNLRLGGQNYNFFSAALDVVGHELTHGVTDFSSGLIYENEPGALNESFSDIMGTAIEFYFQPAGSGVREADYLIGEDIATPGGFRSMENPASFGDPDHYSRRYTGVEDNGGVHINSGIPNQAYYLAVEGGTNRTSGLSVQGVGGSNREQMEKIFYRAFTQLLPADATFAVARAATIQAATDLYGASSPAARAVADAWTAVGVN
jgi:thermolysin